MNLIGAVPLPISASQKSVGVYIGQKEVIAARMSMSQGIPILERFAIEQIGPAAEPQGESTKEKAAPAKKIPAADKAPLFESQAVRRALEKVGAVGREVNMAFNPFHLVTRYFEMPEVPSKEWRTAVPFEASRYVPFKLSEMVSDFHIGERGAAKKEIMPVTYTCTKQVSMRKYVDQARRGSAKVRMVEPVFSALARAIGVGEKMAGDALFGFIFVDANGAVNISLMRGPVVYLSRDFLLSGDRPEDETRFYEEIKSSFDFVLRAVEAEKVERVYLAGSGDIIFWVDFLSGVFQGDTQFEIGSFPTKEEIPKNVLSALLVAIGLALRALKVKSALGDFSLLPLEERTTAKERLSKAVVQELVLIVLVCVFVRLAVLMPYTGYVKNQLAEQVGSEALLEQAMRSKSTAALKQEHIKLQNQVKQLEEFAARGVSIPAKLDAISSSIPKAAWLEEINFRSADDDGASGGGRRGQQRGGGTQGKNRIVLKGYCYLGDPDREVQIINQWLKSIEQNKKFMYGLSRVTLGDIQREQINNLGTTRFEIVCE